MAEPVKNNSVNSATPEMKQSSQNLARTVTKGVIAGLVCGLPIALWVAGSDWTGTIIAAALAIMGAAATIGGLMAANFAAE